MSKEIFLVGNQEVLLIKQESVAQVYWMHTWEVPT